MHRLIFAHTLSLLILASQVSVPMHFHFCKGRLESVSLFFSRKCDDHQEVKATYACCKKLVAKKCEENKDKCCHDKVKLVNAETKSILHSYFGWATDINFGSSHIVQDVYQAAVHIPFNIASPVNDSGPPIFILHHALIYYA